MSETAERAHALSVADKRAILMRSLREKVRNETTSAPLSNGQAALWFLQRSAPESAAYHVAFTVRIRSRVVVAALKRACQRLVDRHAVLRTTYPLRNGAPVQLIHAQKSVDFEHETVWDVSEEELHRRVRDAYMQPFDLERGAVLRARLFSVAEQDHVLSLTIHHIAFDAWSLWIFQDELQAAYRAEVSGGKWNPAPIARSYADHVSAERELLAGAHGEKLWSYWQRELADASTVLDLPADRPRPSVQSQSGASLHFKLETQLSTALKGLARDAGVTPFTLLLSAFQVLLYRYTGQEDILVGSPTAGRNDESFRDVVGYFVNPVVLRARLGAKPKFRELLAQMRDTVLNAMAHADYPFPLLVQRLQPSRDASFSPLFQVSFVLQRAQRAGGVSDGWIPGDTETRMRWGELEVQAFDLPQQEGQFDLELEMIEAAGSFHALFKYNSDLFDATRMERMARHFSCLLESIVNDPNEHIDRLTIIDASERRQLLEEWNATRVEYSQGAWVHQLFERQAEATPDAVALIYAERSLSYAVLNQKVNRLAHCLQRLKVGPGSVVGVCLERSIDMVVALHAVMKAGAAYLPLDPDYPRERLEFMTRDAAVKLILTHSSLADRYDTKGIHVLALDVEAHRIARFSKDNPEVTIAPTDIAYVIYTSGSTGQPKGVAVPHRGLLNRLQWMQAQYLLEPKDKVLQKTPYSFDVSVWEFFWPFMTGAALVVAPPGDHRDSRRLIELINTHGITTAHFVPSMLRAFLEDSKASTCRSVRQVIASGEALNHELEQRFFAALDAELHNLYGPTEASIDVSHWTCRRDSTDPIVPIGYPIANIKLHILDEHLSPVPVGVAGELHIGGVGLARGYLNRPELTEQKFITDPFSSEAGARLYKTGDLARYREGGVIEYLGRLDRQVKLRGFRIELGEIEAALCAREGVSAAAVTVYKARGDSRLVGYVVGTPSAAELREHLLARLPDYMVPSTFVTLERLPLTNSGKIDYRALPAPTRDTSGNRERVAPRDALERVLVERWQSLLNVADIGVRDNFFELGGHSLLAVSLMEHIEQLFDQRLPLAALFRHPTIEELATVLRGGAPVPAWSPVVPIRAQGSERPFFCVAGGGGNVLYFQPLVQALHPDQPFYGVQATGLDGQTAPLTSIEDIARANVQALQAVQPEGPYSLGGHCLGATVAFEMAQQLKRAGHAVAQVVIIDNPAPVMQATSAEEGARNVELDDAAWMTRIAGNIEEASGKSLDMSYDTLAELDPESQLQLFMSRLQGVGFLPADANINHVRGLVEVSKANVRALMNYVPREVQPVPIALLRAGEVHRDYDYRQGDTPLEKSTLGWESYAHGAVSVDVVPGNHITMLGEPHAKTLAVALAARLRAAQA